MTWYGVRGSDKVIEAVRLRVRGQQTKFCARRLGLNSIAHLALTRPCKVPFLAKLATASDVSDGKNGAIFLHPCQDSRAEEWVDRYRETTVTCHILNYLCSARRAAVRA